MQTITLHYNNQPVRLQCTYINSKFPDLDEYITKSIIDKFVTSKDLIRAESVFFISVEQYGTIRLQFSGETRLYFFTYDRRSNSIQFRNPADLKFEEQAEIMSLIADSNSDNNNIQLFNDLAQIPYDQDFYHFIINLV